MTKILKSDDRGHANLGWLDSYHSFSFGDYYHPERMGFRALRVINEDSISGGAGFPMHGHRDMEIITIVTQGVLEHRDTLGNSALIKPGEVQRMSAGTGIQHSEHNHLANEKTHLFQIWILPDREGLKSSYGQKSFAVDIEQKSLVLVVSENGRDGSIPMNQNANIYIGKLKANEKLSPTLSEKRYGWIQMIQGKLTVNGESLEKSDAMAISGVGQLELRAETASEFIFFDLA